MQVVEIVPNPNYKQCEEFSCADVALIVLRDPITSIAPVELAPANLVRKLGWFGELNRKCAFA